MDTERVREFVAFSKLMSFRAAARELHISEPALSSHIRQLEAEVGAPLVNRGVAGAPNTLTPAGLRFVELGGELLDAQQRLLEGCREAAEEASPARISDVNKGFNINAQLREALARFGHHSVNVTYVKIDMPKKDALDRGVVDFAIADSPSPSMSNQRFLSRPQEYGWLPFKPERLGFLMGAGNPLASKDALTKEDVEATEFVYPSSPAYDSWHASLLAAMAACGCSVRSVAIADYTRDGGAIPLLDTRAVIATECFAEYYQGLDVEDVRFLRLAGEEPRIYPFLVYRRDNRAPAVRVIVECLQAAGEGARP